MLRANIKTIIVLMFFVSNSNILAQISDPRIDALISEINNLADFVDVSVNNSVRNYLSDPSHYAIDEKQLELAVIDAKKQIRLEKYARGLSNTTQVYLGDIDLVSVDSKRMVVISPRGGVNFPYTTTHLAYIDLSTESGRTMVMLALNALTAAHPVEVLGHNKFIGHDAAAANYYIVNNLKVGGDV